MFRQRHSATSNSRPGTFPLDIIASGSLEAFNGIANVTATNQYVKW